MDIKTVTVLGTTGTMGANAAGIFASFGNANVYCVGRSIEKVKETIPVIIKSVRADSISTRLNPVDYSSLEKCVMESDLIFECVKEDISIKKEIATRVGKAMRSHAISATGTSGLSIKQIADCYPEGLRNRFIGIHMFNPPYTLPVCELVTTDNTDQLLKEDLKKYLRNILYRTVIEVKDSPAFLGNRIGFQFINEVLQYAERYKDYGGINYMDAVLGPFTGRIMAPIKTSNFVGLDVHQTIVNNLYNNTNDYARETFLFPDFAKQLVNKGKLGKKTDCGFYARITGTNGKHKELVYDIKTDEYHDITSYSFPFAINMKHYIHEGDYHKAFECLINDRSLEAELCLSFLLKYIIYSFYVTKNVGYSLLETDDVMAMGFNWCPPLALFGQLSAVTNVLNLIKERLPEIYMIINTDELLSEVVLSKYDARRYFRSKE